ncbi:MAG: GNAT family N-acetyltransferase [Bacteroidota bacterium]
MTTEHFIIDALQPTDANLLYQFLKSNNERLKRYFPKTLSSNETVENAVEYIATKNKEIEEKTNFTFAIRDKNTQAISGLIILKNLDWDKKQGEFAYCIGSGIEGKGITSFAVKKMIHFAFGKLQLKTLQIICHKTNLGSSKVAINNGFVWKKTLPNEFTPTDEKPLDMELYELTNER